MYQVQNTDSTNEVMSNQVVIKSNGGGILNAVAVNTITGGSILASGNVIKLYGGTKMYGANLVGEYDTLTSHFDDVIAHDKIIGLGSKNYDFVNSPSNGNIQVSGGYLNMYDNAKTVANRGGDYTVIQDAINASISGQTIIIYPGTYYENIEMKEGVTLKGQCANTTIINGKFSYSGTTNTVLAYLKIITENQECINMNGSGSLNIVKCNLESNWINGVGQTENTAKSVIDQSNGSLYIRNQTRCKIIASGDNIAEHNTCIYYSHSSNKCFLSSFATRHHVYNEIDENQNIEILFSTNINTDSIIKIKNGFCNLFGINNTNNYIAPFYMYNSKAETMIDGNIIIIENSGHVYCAFNFNSDGLTYFTSNSIFPNNITDEYIGYDYSGLNKIYAYNNFWDSDNMPQIHGDVFYNIETREKTQTNIETQFNGNKIGFFSTAPVVKATNLTVNNTSVVDSTYGTEEVDVINNLRTRLLELETKLKNYGLLS
jgi:hypothetical protein